MARERRIEESLAHWEREIVPDWRVVYKDQRLRRMWWQGIPSKLRATMWQNAVGNELALSKGKLRRPGCTALYTHCLPETYKMCLTRAKRALQTGSFPTTALAMLEDDIRRDLIAFLSRHHDCFAWSHADMTGIDPSVITHKLQVDPECIPIRQKTRKFAPE